MAIQIRGARVEDYAQVCEVFAEADDLHLAGVPKLFRRTDGPVRRPEFIVDILANHDAVLLVAEDKEQVIGVVVAATRQAPDIPLLVPRRYVVIDTLAVRSTHRRQGVGRALMARVEQWALDRGIKELELNVWEFNRDALTFYEELGYTTASRRMWKTIP